MAVFSYLYYNNFIAKLATVSLGTVLNTVVQMDSRAQIELFSQLGSMLAAKRQIPGTHASILCPGCTDVEEREPLWSRTKFPRPALYHTNGE